MHLLSLVALVAFPTSRATNAPTRAPTSMPTIECHNFTLSGSWSGGKSRYLGDFLYSGHDFYNNPYYQLHQCTGDRHRFYVAQPYYIAYRPRQMVEDKNMWVITDTPLLESDMTETTLPLYWRAESNMKAPFLMGDDKWEYYNGHDGDWKGVTSSDVSVVCLHERRVCVKDPKIRWRFIIMWCIISLFILLVLLAFFYERKKDGGEESFPDPFEGSIIYVMNDKLGYRVEMIVAQIAEKAGITLVVLAAGPNETAKVEERYVDLGTYLDLQKEERAYNLEEAKELSKKPSLLTRIFDPTAGSKLDKKKAKLHTLPTGFLFTTAADANREDFARMVVKKKKRDPVKMAELNDEKQRKEQRMKELATKRKKLMQETFSPEESKQAEARTTNNANKKTASNAAQSRRGQESKDEMEYAGDDYEEGGAAQFALSNGVMSNKVRMESALRRRLEKAELEKAAEEKRKYDLKVAKMLNISEKKKKKKKKEQKPDIAEDKFSSLVTKGPKAEPMKSAKASAQQKKSDFGQKQQAAAEEKDGGTFTDILGAIF